MIKHDEEMSFYLPIVERPLNHFPVEFCTHSVDWLYPNVRKQYVLDLVSAKYKSLIVSFYY